MALDPDNKPLNPRSVWQDAGASGRGSEKIVITTKKKRKTPAADGPEPVIPFWDSPESAYTKAVDPGQYDPNTGAYWSPWDTATLAGMRVPGRVAVRSRKHRKLLTPGAIGAQSHELVDTGAEASMVEFCCTLWLPEHLSQYHALRKAIEVKGGSRQNPKALVADHPGLALLGIRSLYVTSIGMPEPHSPGGVYVATIEAQEWKPIDKKGKSNATLPIAADADNVKSKYRDRVPSSGSAPSAGKSTAKP